MKLVSFAWDAVCCGRKVIWGEPVVIRSAEELFYLLDLLGLVWVVYNSDKTVEEYPIGQETAEKAFAEGGVMGRCSSGADQVGSPLVRCPFGTNSVDQISKRGDRRRVPGQGVVVRVWEPPTIESIKGREGKDRLSLYGLQDYR